MKKRLFFMSLVVMCVVAISTFAAAQPGQSQGDKRISDIRINGNNAVSSATILSRLKIRTGDIFDDGALNKEIKRLYATGYFSDVLVETKKRIEGIVVIFTVVEKPLIDKIEFRGNIRINERKLAKKITVKEGTVVDFNLLRQDVSELTTYYVEEGYSSVDIDYKIETASQTGEVTIVFLIDEGLPFKIKSIEIEGNEEIPDNELKKYMSIKTAWWFIRKGAFDEDKFESDLERIGTVYRSRGFLDARVTSKVEYSEDKKSINLIVIVDEGKKYLVGKIDIQGKLAFPEKEIRDIIKIKSGDPFDYTKIKEDVDEIRTFYYDKGYMNADIDLRHKYNSTMDKMNLIYDIQAHDEVYVGRINIIGNTKTKDKVIRRELRLYPGEKYDGKKLKLSKEKIYNRGFFEDVYFETVPTKKKNVKDLNVTVKESKTGEFSFGGGYSSIDSFIGFVQIRQKNFDITNPPTFTGSGQDLVVRAEVGSARTNYLLSWTDPWIFDYPLLFGFDLYRQEHESYGQSGYDYAERRTGGSLKLGKEVTDEVSAGLVYNLEEVSISDIPTAASQDLRDERGDNWISRLTGNLQYDTRNNVFSPSEGWLAGISVENAGGFIGGDKDFAKVFTNASYYRGITASVVLELKARVGVIEPYGDSVQVPIYERFFAGGASTIRGYDQRGVGPRDTSDPNLVVGGNAMVIGNAEVVFPIFKNVIKGAVFYDVGSVTKDAKDILSVDESSYKMGVGVGVRVKTPIGPVKLDWGYPLSDNEGDDKEGQFYFSVSQGF